MSTERVYFGLIDNILKFSWRYPEDFVVVTLLEHTVHQHQQN